MSTSGKRGATARVLAPAAADREASETQYETQPLTVTRAGASLHLKLWRARGHRRGAPAVLLLHGGNSSSTIFMEPLGGLAGYLRSAGVDVWLLEWRASPVVLNAVLAREPLNGSVQAEREVFTLDRAAAEDLPEALAVIRATIGGSATLGILGHCLAGAVVSMAVARGYVEPFRVNSVTLLTLGLFVRVPWSGWIKAEDSILERILRNAPDCRDIHPERPDQWPADMAAAYRKWPGTWLPSGPDFLRAMTFMVGLPYTPERVAEGLGTAAASQHFGSMHLGLYLHAGQIVRRGYCAPMNASELAGARGAQSDLCPTHFRDKQVTLLAASNNHIWHRDSVDRMYEWLRNHGCSNSTKHVLSGYNLQELLWSPSARSHVYPLIAAAIHAAPALRPHSHAAVPAEQRYDAAQ